MKLAIFTDTFTPEVNGVVNSIMNSSIYLTKKGYEIKIFAPRYNSKDKNEETNNLSVERIFSFPLPSYKDVRISLPNFNAHLKTLRKFNPDIIHIHTPGTIGLLGVIYGKKYNKPIVGTYHTVLHDFTMHLSPLRIFQLDGFLYRMGWKKNLTMNQYKINDTKSFSNSGMEMFTSKSLKRFVWYLTKLIYNKCNIVISSTNSVKKLLIENRIVVPIEIISVGIDFKKFSQKNDYPLNSYKLLYVGRISHEKNIDILIKAMKYVVKKERKAVLTLIGRGPATELCKLLTKRLNLNGNIIFKGQAPYASLYKKYMEYDIFCTASTIETLGLAILEAMSSGLPIIGVKALAIPEIVHHGENGFLSKPNSPKEMAENILALLKTPSLRERFGEKSRKIAKEHDIVKSVDKLDRLYKNLSSQNAKENKKF